MNGAGLEDGDRVRTLEVLPDGDGVLWPAGTIGHLRAAGPDLLAIVGVVLDSGRHYDGRDHELVLLARRDQLAAAPFVFVSAYAVTRHYGGPEEGGWWYDWYELIQTVPTAPDGADVVRGELERVHSSVNVGDRFSVLGGATLSVMVEDSPGEFETRERPHYE